MALINKYRETLGKELWKKVCDFVKENNVEHPLPLCLLGDQGDATCRMEGRGPDQSGWYPGTKRQG